VKVGRGVILGLMAWGICGVVGFGCCVWWGGGGFVGVGLCWGMGWWWWGGLWVLCAGVGVGGDWGFVVLVVLWVVCVGFCLVVLRCCWFLVVVFGFVWVGVGVCLLLCGWWIGAGGLVGLLVVGCGWFGGLSVFFCCVGFWL